MRSRKLMVHLEATGELRSGQLSLQISGPPARTVLMQRSADFVTWSPWQTVATGAAPLVIQNIVVGATAHQFYRFISP